MKYIIFALMLLISVSFASDKFDVKCESKGKYKYLKLTFVKVDDNDNIVFQKSNGAIVRSNLEDVKEKHRERAQKRIQQYKKEKAERLAYLERKKALEKEKQ